MTHKQFTESMQSMRARIAALESAIRNHRDQKADDRCIEDDDRLYEALGDGIKCDRRVGSKTEMLANCQRFINNRCETGGPWKSYAELEAELAALREFVRRAHERRYYATGVYWQQEDLDVLEKYAKL